MRTTLSTGRVGATQYSSKNARQWSKQNHECSNNKAEVNKSQSTEKERSGSHGYHESEFKTVSTKKRERYEFDKVRLIINRSSIIKRLEQFI